MCGADLEPESQCEFHLPCEVQLRHGKNAEIRTGWVGGVRVSAQRRVGGVIRFGAELYLVPFTDLEDLADRRTDTPIGSRTRAARPIGKPAPNSTSSFLKQPRPLHAHS